jgi:tetratricopeptide (TPR) repeat protein
VSGENYIALSNLGSALADEGRLTEGNENIRKALQINPNNRAVVFEHSGDTYAKLGLVREAAEQYRKALAIKPYETNVQEKLSALGNAANTALSASAALDPHQGMVGAQQEYERGNLLARTGQREQAVAAYRAAIDKAPGHTEAWHNLGCALGELGRLDEATAAFEETLRLKPD